MTEQDMYDFVFRLRNTYYPDVDMPTVSFNPRLKTSAGRAWARKIEINKNLMEMVGGEGMKHTLAHEFAHCVQFQLYNDKYTSPHGVEWRSIMQYLGYEPQTTHKLFAEYDIERPM